MLQCDNGLNRGNYYQEIVSIFWLFPYASAFLFALLHNASRVDQTTSANNNEKYTVFGIMGPNIMR